MSSPNTISSAHSVLFSLLQNYKAHSSLKVLLEIPFTWNTLASDVCIALSPQSGMVHISIFSMRLSLTILLKIAHLLPPKFCYNLSNSVQLEMRPMYTEDLCSKRQFLRFIDKFKIVHINMSLTTKRAKLTISKSGIIWCIYLATSLTDYCTQGHFRIMLHEVTWQVRDSFYHIKNCSILSLSRETNIVGYNVSI